MHTNIFWDATARRQRERAAAVRLRSIACPTSKPRSMEAEGTSTAPGWGSERTFAANQRRPVTFSIAHGAKGSLPAQAGADGADGDLATNPTSASRCELRGDGLLMACTRQLAVFTITAHNRQGEAKQHGGDPFLVTVRGRGESVRAKVVDHLDGTYSVRTMDQHGRGTGSRARSSAHCPALDACTHMCNCTRCTARVSSRAHTRARGARTDSVAQWHPTRVPSGSALRAIIAC